MSHNRHIDCCIYCFSCVSSPPFYFGGAGFELYTSCFDLYIFSILLKAYYQKVRIDAGIVLSVLVQKWKVLIVHRPDFLAVGIVFMSVFSAYFMNLVLMSFHIFQPVICIFLHTRLILLGPSAKAPLPQAPPRRQPAVPNGAGDPPRPRPLCGRPGNNCAGAPLPSGPPRPL